MCTFKILVSCTSGPRCAQAARRLVATNQGRHVLVVGCEGRVIPHDPLDLVVVGAQTGGLCEILKQIDL